MTDPLRPLRANALELLRQPGTERDVVATIAATALDVAHPALDGDIAVEYRLTSLHDGIVVHGTVHTPWAAGCRRCLRPLAGTDHTEVDELYQRDVTEPDAYAIEHDQLDLAPVTRETALLTLDDERLCRPDCAGLCPVCGIDRNVERCDCDTTVRDERWAVLDELRLED
jgi:uncharacterized protein